MRKFRAFFERQKGRKNPAPTANAMERPTRNFRTFFEHLKTSGKYSPGVCIDVGAASGTTDIYESFPEAHHIAFEPLPDFRQALSETLRPYSHEIHHCALMEKPGQTTLLRHADKYGSSVMHKRTGDAQDLVPIEVKTLDGVIADRDFPNGLLIKTDCQGSDLLVIKGGLNTLKKADVVIMEASLFRFWGPHHPDIYDIIHFMKARNFVLYDVLDGLFRPLDNALAQLDLVFVRENGQFRKEHFWQARRA